MEKTPTPEIEDWLKEMEEKLERLDDRVHELYLAIRNLRDDSEDIKRKIDRITPP